MAIILCSKCQNEVKDRGLLNRIVDKSTLRVNKPAYYEILELFECIECRRMYCRMVDSWPIKSL